MDSTAALVETDRRHLIHPLHHARDHEHPVLVVEGRGEILIDAEGKQYIDGLSSLWNVNAGHGRKELADAAAGQMAKLSFASAYVGASNIPSIRLAEKLVKLAYPSTSGVYFTTAGAESNESAFKIARYYWKLRGKPDKVKIFSRVHAYHGLTIAAMSATGMAAYHKMFGPLVPNFLQVPAPYPYRWPGNDDPGIGAAEAFERAIVKEGPETVAAIIAEPVMGAGGVIVPPATYFPRLREICDRHGILLIADEVITGFGRTGRWFAVEHDGVVPDLMTVAKGITSGYIPLSAAITRRRLADAFPDDAKQENVHPGTYAGHPVACAAALANIQIMEKDNLVANAAAMGERLKDGLQQAVGKKRIVGEVRGRGLMVCAELVAPDGSGRPLDQDMLTRLDRKAWTRGVIVSARGQVVRLAPPLCITREEVDTLVDVVAASIGELEAELV